MNATDKALVRLPGSTDNQRPALHRDIGSTRLTPFLVTRQDLDALFRSPTLVTELIKAGWIGLVRHGKQGRAALFDYASAERAADRLKKGEEPQAQPAGGRGE